MGRSHEPPRRPGDLRLRDGAHLAHLAQSIVSPVLSTSLYFVVFGAALGSRIQSVDGVSYGAFIVPGLVMLSLLTQSIANASFGIYFPRFTGTIYEILSAPISAFEIVAGYVGAAATKSIVLGLIIIATSALFVPLHVEHPLWMVVALVLTSVTFSAFGFVIGIWADGFEKLQLVPLLIVTPLTFLGGSFYSIDSLPSPWREVAYLNPVVYLVNGFRWSFLGHADVPPEVSFGMTLAILALCAGADRLDLPDGIPAEDVSSAFQPAPRVEGWPDVERATMMSPTNCTRCGTRTSSRSISSFPSTTSSSRSARSGSACRSGSTRPTTGATSSSRATTSARRCRTAPTSLTAETHDGPHMRAVARRGVDHDLLRGRGRAGARAPRRLVRAQRRLLRTSRVGGPAGELAAAAGCSTRRHHSWSEHLVPFPSPPP